MADYTDLDYVLCDTDISIRKAFALLNTSSIVALDCEGRDLGETGGKLSLISLRTIRPAHSAQTFLIDTVRLKGERLRPIYDILESTRVLNVVYDGRKDFSCLFHDRHVEIRNVIDLQLADIKSREIRGENDADRVLRLGQAVPRWELSRKPHLYSNIHKLSGMAKSAEEHLGLKIERNSVKFDHHLWLERPLVAEQLLYAAKDVVMISDLYNAFDAAGYLYPQILDDSSRYVSIWKDRRPAAQDIFRNHGFLIFGILDRSMGSITGTCSSCRRDLPRTCFSKSNWKNDAPRQCLVCRAAEEFHTRRLRREALKKREKEIRRGTENGNS